MFSTRLRRCFEQQAFLSRLHGVKKVHNLNSKFRPPAAFVLDIDGVLLHGSRSLPEASRALKILNGNNAVRVKLPYIVLTNGGGTSEEERSRTLSSQLCPPESGYSDAISPSQVLQGHTILKSVAHKYADAAVLILGGKRDDLRHVAHSYGFKRAYTTHDVLAWNSSVWPFYSLMKEDRLYTKTVDFSRTPISAVFVFHDPRNWGLDIQVVCDVIRSGGVIGGPYRPNGHSSVDLVFCNPDVIWRNDFERPRLGQGAFIKAFQSVYKSLTGSECPCTQFGKPTRATFTFAEEALTDQVEALHGHRHLPSVYMIGDNPESDVAGANTMGWHSILVHTGVYNPKDGKPAHQPTHQAAHVEDAVVWALERELAAERP